MIKSLPMLVVAVMLGATLWVLPSDASAANCNFNRNEKISMVSWIIPIAGAVITPMACRRDMFNKKNKGAAIEPRRNRVLHDSAVADRRRRGRG